jgi:hypothetical protein
VPLLFVLFFVFACGHAQPTPSPAPSGRRVAQGPAPGRSGDPAANAAQISEEARAVLIAEGDLLWKRWTTGSGPMPASALAEHPRLAQREAIDVVNAAAARASTAEARGALSLLGQHLSTLMLSREAGAEIDALERARAQLAFATPGEARPIFGERDLDRLLTDEADPQKRALIGQAEATAAQSLGPLALARDAAVEKAIQALGVDDWGSMEERAHGMKLSELEQLAEATLKATEDVTERAVEASAVRNLGITSDRLRRADLPRMARTAIADPQFQPGKAWPFLRDVLIKIGVPPPAGFHLDAEPSPSKGGRPLALLVDPPRDVRLSLRPAGGFEEQRATLHEGARAVGGAYTAVPRWELAQLGDGSAQLGIALLFESLAGDPEWLRATTQLRGEPLDDLVHTEATRRLLATRRAAALVLFEIRRRNGSRSADAQATLYRGLLQRALFCAFSDDDTGRWALEADSFTLTAPAMLGAVLGAQLEQKLGTGWWNSPQPALKQLWAGGRSLTALEAARAFGLAGLDPAALAAVADARLRYSAPDAPPQTPKPDYKYMQGDKKKKKKKAKKKQ